MPCSFLNSECTYIPDNVWSCRGKNVFKCIKAKRKSNYKQVFVQQNWFCTLSHITIAFLGYVYAGVDPQ